MKRETTSSNTNTFVDCSLGDTRSDREIYVTKNYDRFTFKDNRRIDEKHVKKLKKQISNKDLSAESPIKVTREYVIRDGQHTYCALVEMNLPIYYIFSDMKADDVPVYNSSKKSWKIIDYLEYYCDKGVHEYRVFSGFMKTYNFTCGTALSIVYGQSGGYTTQLFRDGELRIVDRLIEVQRLADKIMKCGKYTPFDLGRSFVLAMLDIFTHPDYKHQTMLRKMKMRQGQMHSCASKHEYLRLLEKVYNYKNTEKLRFI